MAVTSSSPGGRAFGLWPPLALVLQRLAQAVPVLLLITVLSFLLLQLAPGDFLDPLRADLIAQEEARLGLDKPLVGQYLTWLGNLLQGDFGLSYTYRVPVAQLILSRAGATLLLAVCSVLLTWLIAVPLGILGALRQNTPLDRALQLLSYLGQAMPSFVLAILLLIVAQNVGWLPVGGMTSVYFAELGWGEAAGSGPPPALAHAGPEHYQLCRAAADYPRQLLGRAAAGIHPGGAGTGHS